MKYSLIFSLIIIIIGQTQSQNDPDKWTPEDIINTEYISNVVFSPDASMIAWTKSKALKKEDKFVSDIFITYLEEEKDGMPLTVQMTRGKHDNSSPVFSADNDALYFLSNRDEGKKLWKLSLMGGEAEEIHEFENGISRISRMDDSTLIFRSNDGKSLYEQLNKEKKDNSVVVEDEEHWTTAKLYSFDLKKKRINRLSDNEYPISSYSISPNGEWIVYQQSMSLHYASDAQAKPQVYLYHVPSGKTNRILSDLHLPSRFQFTASSNGFYFVSTRTSDPEWNGAGVNLVHYYQLADNQVHSIDVDWDWETEGDLVVLGEDVAAGLPTGTGLRLAYFKKNGTSWNKHIPDLEEKMDHTILLAASRDGGKAVYNYSTGGKLPAYYITELENRSGELHFTSHKEIIKLNKKLQKKSIVQHEVLKWKGYNGEEVDGILYYPEGYEEGKAYPLMLSIHGGPSGVDMDMWRERWSTYPQIIAQRGSFVLKPNYHGSSHHGQEFVESIKLNYYEPEMEDILNAIDMLAEEGKVDKNQLGVMGWSNGAIIATMLTVRYPNMFKVACPGAGDVNWTSDFGTCRFGVRFDQSYFGGAPWDNTNGKTFNEAYIEKSPLFELEKVVTPTIIFHGSEDRSVPRDQGWEYYRALQQIGKAPVKFIWFPGQPHGLRKITHQLRKMNEELAWIDKYFFDKDGEDNEALKKESPLAIILKMEKLAKHNGSLGKNHNGTLIPEVQDATDKDIAISPFEVTNAQYKAFKGSHSFEDGKEDYPAVVSLSDANDYINWLNGLTGEKYRLPDADEAKSLHEAGKKKADKENTLNYWAGYKINPEDATELADELGKVSGSLVKKVGSHPPIKWKGVDLFDIGGNVTEFSSDGTKIGFSVTEYVDLFADQKSSHKNGAIRLVMDKK